MKKSHMQAFTARAKKTPAILAMPEDVADALDAEQAARRVVATYHPPRPFPAEPYQPRGPFSAEHLQYVERVTLQDGAKTVTIRRAANGQWGCLTCRSDSCRHCDFGKTIKPPRKNRRKKTDPPPVPVPADVIFARMEREQDESLAALEVKAVPAARTFAAVRHVPLPEDPYMTDAVAGPEVPTTDATATVPGLFVVLYSHPTPTGGVSGPHVAGYFLADSESVALTKAKAQNEMVSQMETVVAHRLADSINHYWQVQQMYAEEKNKDLWDVVKAIGRPECIVSPSGEVQLSVRLQDLPLVEHIETYSEFSMTQGVIKAAQRAERKRARGGR